MKDSYKTGSFAFKLMIKIEAKGTKLEGKFKFMDGHWNEDKKKSMLFRMIMCQLQVSILKLDFCRSPFRLWDLCQLYFCQSLPTKTCSLNRGIGLLFNNILLFEEQMWPSYLFLSLLIWWWKEPLPQSKVKHCLEISLSQQCLLEPLFICYITASWYYICWKTFLYFKLIHIGVKIQSQLRSMAFVDSSIVHIILTWLGNADILYLLPGILTKVNLSLCNLFSWN